jgi:hypothetical protein
MSDYLGGKSSGTGAGMGSVSIKVPLPAHLPKNAFIHRQWAVNEPGAGSLVISNARSLTIK